MTEQDLETQLVESIREIGIPPCPTILIRVTTMLREDEPDMRRLSKLLSTDVGVSGSLIKLVNSPFYGLRTKVRTVDAALNLLGLRTIASTVANIMLRRALPAAPQLERFWDASARIAQLSAWLASRLGVRHEVRADLAYTFGLFRDCGLPIMMSRVPGYAETLALANQEAERMFTEVEDERHPTNHAMVGCLLAQSWWLDERLCIAIRHHHDAVSLRVGAGALPANSVRLICLSHLAEWLGQQVTGMALGCEWQKLGPSVLRLLELDEDGAAALIEPARAALQDDSV